MRLRVKVDPTIAVPAVSAQWYQPTNGAGTIGAILRNGQLTALLRLDGFVQLGRGEPSTNLNASVSNFAG